MSRHSKSHLTRIDEPESFDGYLQMIASNPQENSKRFIQAKELLDTYSKIQLMPEQCLENIFGNIKMKKDLTDLQFMTIELGDFEIKISELEKQFETEIQRMRDLTRKHRPQSSTRRRFLDLFHNPDAHEQSDSAKSKRIQRKSCSKYCSRRRKRESSRVVLCKGAAFGRRSREPAMWFSLTPQKHLVFSSAQHRSTVCGEITTKNETQPERQ